MKLETPVNANYAAVVVQVKVINELENCDNVVGVPLLGFNAIVGKDIKVGDIGILFPPETQLSAEYASNNNLYRHAQLNVDPEAKGYLEDNTRVRAMKFRGHVSNALFMPLSSLEYLSRLLPEDIAQLKVGDVFDRFLGHEICRKYLIKVPVSRVEKNKVRAKERRVDEKMLPAHFDTDNYFRNKDAIPAGTEVIVTAKLHGTSVRLGNVLVKRKLSWKDKLAKWFGVSIKEFEYDYIAGSRRVIKDPADNDQDHYYSTDIWTKALDKVKGTLPEGFIVYGELIGWTDSGAPIQSNYTYQVPQGTNELYVYRVAQVNTQGRSTDLSWTQVKEFCKDSGLKHVPELSRVNALELEAVVEDYLDKRFYDIGYRNCPQLDSGKLVDEGICIRVDGLVPYILKAKSPLFFEHETKLLDKDIVDIESDN